jgi:putative N6-adenine-specific DNA methylase
MAEGACEAARPRPPLAAMPDPIAIFLVVPPGLEAEAAAEARAAGLHVTATGPGGVTVAGGWPEVWRANLALRGASRVLVRIGAFRAMHLAQLDKRARRFPWGDVLRPDVPVRVEATCRASRIYHEKAAAQRVAAAIAGTLGATVAETAPVRVLVRIDDDLCTLSLDTSGEPLHRRGHKAEVGKAPLRETIAAMLLARMGYAGGVPLVDPMCGSGTIPIEAAGIAAGLLPGRARGFAFELLATHDPAAVAALRALPPRETALRFHGSDRDDGAIRIARANADRAGVGPLCTFTRAAISDAAPPEGPPGIVLVNPPYGTRIGARRLLHGLYGAFGAAMRARFAGWRVGVITPDAGLAASTGLALAPLGPPVAHGGLRVQLFAGQV